VFSVTKRSHMRLYHQLTRTANALMPVREQHSE
jgi:hypothetical protein